MTEVKMSVLDFLVRIEDLIKELGAFEGNGTPKWLTYGVVCSHDDGLFCNCRQRYFINYIIAGIY